MDPSASAPHAPSNVPISHEPDAHPPVSYSLGEDVRDNLAESLARALHPEQSVFDGEETPLRDEYNGAEEDDPFFCGDSGKW